MWCLFYVHSNIFYAICLKTHNSNPQHLHPNIGGNKIQESTLHLKTCVVEREESQNAIHNEIFSNTLAAMQRFVSGVYTFPLAVLGFGSSTTFFQIYFFASCNMQNHNQAFPCAINYIYVTSLQQSTWKQPSNWLKLIKWLPLWCHIIAQGIW